MSGDAAPEVIDTGNLIARCYRRDPNRVVVVFCSAGARRVDGVSEEFRGSLWPLGVSAVFVTDRYFRWFNYPDTEVLFAKLDEWLAGFLHIAVLGESLGGSGAILYSRFAKRLDRVLAFTPQFSVFPPFILFDARYTHVALEIGTPLYTDFATSAVKEKIAILYGNTEWRDYLHAAMFTANGYAVLTVDGAPHEMGGYLKAANGATWLRDLLEAFTDFSWTFSAAALRARVAMPWSVVVLREEHGFQAELSGLAVFIRNMNNPVPLVPSEWPLLSQGKPATQSSLSEWSLGDSLEADAAGAVSGEISARASFHTQSEDGAWWAVDLLRPCQVFEIRLFNRLEQYPIARRGYRFKIEGRLPGAAWQTLAVKDDDAYVGGVDGRPYRVVLPSGPRCQEIRVALLGVGFLHLNQVQVFGLSGHI